MELKIHNEYLEYPLCPVCNGKDASAVYKFTPFNVVQCQTCNFYFLSPRPVENFMLKVYSDNAYFGGDSIGYEDYYEQESALRATFRRLLNNMRRLNMTGGALLEVGCGYGYLLDEARGFFDVRIGTEFSNHALQQAKMKADFIYADGVEKIPDNDKFDCIVLFNVIEHLYHPKQFLEDLGRHLSPGGKMIIATPDMNSFWRRFMGRKWPSFKIPEHVNYFDADSLEFIMKQAGLSNIRKLPCPHAFPLSLIASKMNIPFPLKLGRFIVWFPAIMVALYGDFSHE